MLLYAVLRDRSIYTVLGIICKHKDGHYLQVVFTHVKGWKEDKANVSFLFELRPV